MNLKARQGCSLQVRLLETVKTIVSTTGNLHISVWLLLLCQYQGMVNDQLHYIFFLSGSPFHWRIVWIKPAWCCTTEVLVHLVRTFFLTFVGWCFKSLLQAQARPVQIFAKQFKQAIILHYWIVGQFSSFSIWSALEILCDFDWRKNCASPPPPPNLEFSHQEA